MKQLIENTLLEIDHKKNRNPFTVKELLFVEFKFS
jgi:hypothetical protein